MSASEGSPRARRQPGAARAVSADTSGAKSDALASIMAGWPNSVFIATHLQLHLAIRKMIPQSIWPIPPYRLRPLDETPMSKAKPVSTN
jgi:hypothetical protein